MTKQTTAKPTTKATPAKKTAAKAPVKTGQAEVADIAEKQAKPGRRRPTIKTQPPAKPEAQSAATVKKITDAAQGGGKSTAKVADKPAAQSAASNKRGKSKTGGTAKQAPVEPEVPAARQPVKNADGKIDDKSFTGFERFRPILKDTDRNKARVEARFDRPLSHGTEVSHAVLATADEIDAKVKSVRGLALIDESLRVYWFLGLDPKQQSAYWAVGTIGEDQDSGKVIVVREYRDGRIVGPSRMSTEETVKMFELGFAWDADDIRRWQTEPAPLSS